MLNYQRVFVHHPQLKFGGLAGVHIVHAYAANRESEDQQSIDSLQATLNAKGQDALQVKRRKTWPS